MELKIKKQIKVKCMRTRIYCGDASHLRFRYCLRIAKF